MIVYHVVLLGLLVGTTVLATTLSLLNVKHGADEIAANEGWLADQLAIEDTKELVDYLRASTGLSLLQTWVTLVLLIGALYTGVFTAAVDGLHGTGWHVVGQGVVFFAALIIAHRLVSAPFSLYSTFVIDEHFEFNEQTPRLWVRDFLLQLGIGVLIVAAVVGILLALIEVLATTFWVVGGWILVIAFMLFMQVLYPRVIAPLFNDFEPVVDGELRDRVEDVFERAGFELEEVYTMDASRRSSRLNAYFIGFGRAKRVVLFDTLVETLEGPEIEGVLAHELAHWKRGHIWKRLGAAAIQLGIVFAVLGYLLTAEWIFELFSLPAEATYAGLFVAILFVWPVLELSAPLVNRLSLAHEREADAFAVDVMGEGKPMVGALSTLAQENLANPFPHPWYAAFNHQHPPIPERIMYIQDQGEIEAGMVGGTGETSGKDGEGPTVEDGTAE